MKAKFPAYNARMESSVTDNVIKIFRKDFWPQPAVGLDTMVPVFIVGMMRSGSTLTETMLDAHKHVWGMGEESLLSPMLTALQGELLAVLQRPDHQDELRGILAERGGRVLDAMTRAAEDATANSTRKGVIKRVVDKMLFNYRNVGFIHLMFPNAVIIHTVRDPLDTVLSCYKHKFADQEVAWTLDPEALVHEYVMYLETMAHFREVLPGRVHDVRYEEMVRDPENTIRGVISKLKLDWDPNVMDFHKTNRTVQTMSMSQVGALCRFANMQLT